MRLRRKRLPIIRDSAEADRFNIAVVHGDFRPRRVPHAFGGYAGRRSLDFGDPVAAPLAAGRLRERPRPAQRQFAGRDEIIPLLEQSRCAIEGQGGEVGIRVRVNETLQRGLVAGVLVFAEGNIPAPGEAFEIRVGEGRVRGIPAVKIKQGLVKLNRPQFRLGSLRGAGLPGQKLLRRIEDGAVGGHFKSVFGAGGGLLAGGIEGKRLMGDEVVEGGTVTIGHGTFGQKVVPGANGGRLQERAGTQRLLE